MEEKNKNDPRLTFRINGIPGVMPFHVGYSLCHRTGTVFIFKWGGDASDVALCLRTCTIKSWRRMSSMIKLFWNRCWKWQNFVIQMQILSIKKRRIVRILLWKMYAWPLFNFLAYTEHYKKCVTYHIVSHKGWALKRYILWSTVLQ